MLGSKVRWAVWLVILAVMNSGCLKKVSAAYAPMPAPIPVAPIRYDVCAAVPSLCVGIGRSMLSQQDPSGRGQEIMLTGPLAAAPAVRAQRIGLTETISKVEKLATASPRTPTAPTPIPTSAASAQRTFIDLEANLSIEVPDPRASAQTLRALVATAAGEVVNETIEDNASQMGAALSIRVPSERASWLIDRASELGKVTSLKTQSTDVGRKVVDAETVLQNLEAALARYQELLKQADNVKDMAEIQRDLDRVALALDRVKADLTWMKDRAARSTLYVQFSLPSKQRVEQTAKLHVGVRLPYAADLGPALGRDGYFGGGLSLLVLRAFNLDLDLMTHVEASRRNGVALLLATAGSEFYSNLLGAGERRYLNPYLGFRLGYANLIGDGAFTIGGSVGIELVKTRLFALEIETRALGLVGAANGTHVLLVPAMTARVAY